MLRKTKVGKVVSDKNSKTIVIEVHRRKKHPRYHKYIRVRKRFMAHDENETATVGDTVRIMESRPLSARKHWVLEAIITRGVGPEVEVRHEEDLAVALGREEAGEPVEETAEEAEGEAVEEAIQAEEQEVQDTASVEAVKLAPETSDEAAPADTEIPAETTDTEALPKGE